MPVSAVVLFIGANTDSKRIKKFHSQRILVWRVRDDEAGHWSEVVLLAI